ncbi:amino acid permease 6-like [Pistacia vera]|uniref:amino acid permease 6-like n=1 Tax=Pistacia vera TaxID=55513 RepID=UPI001262FD64|nr:amino acid permease 6-like [Pistacia vera]
MAIGLQERTLSIETGIANSKFDEDGRVKRTGTWVTASAHIITAVIGSGVLSLAWAIAQLGWITGPAAIFIFSIITWFTSTLLADCYRSPTSGSRNYTYIDVVKANLGGIKYKFCGLAQYGNLVGITVGYTITASVSMAAVIRSDCFHKKGHNAGCHTSNNKYMISFAITEIILSQIPNFHELSCLSIIAAVMSFAYSLIGLALSIAKIAGGNHARTSLTGVSIGVDVTSTEKIWNSLQAIGDIAFAYSFAVVLVEIQDTLKSSPPETQVMKKASFVGVSVTTVFYMLCGTLGYAAFGNNAPGNFLTGFGFYEPFWLVAIANVCIVVHLVGAYQVFCQPIYNTVEKWCCQRWPESEFITKGYSVTIPLCGVHNINIFRLVWRTVYVTVTAVIAMIFPFFNSVLGLLGAASFWPLTVYFPIEMYISRETIGHFSFTWLWLKLLTLVCLIISLLAAAASIQGLIKDLHSFKPFSSVS